MFFSSTIAKMNMVVDKIKLIFVIMIKTMEIWSEKSTMKTDKLSSTR